MHQRLFLRFSLLATASSALLAQRQVPPPRTSPSAGEHIAYQPHQYRGSNFWPTRSLGPTNLWNRYPSNREAIEAHFAHCARAGVNVMRIFVDYQAFLWSRLFDKPGQPNAFADKVLAIMDLANRYEIGLIPVFFNPVGFATPIGVCCQGCACLAPPESTGVSATPVWSPDCPPTPDWALLTLRDDACDDGNYTEVALWLAGPSSPTGQQVLYRTPALPFNDDKWRLAAVQHGMTDYLDSVCTAIGSSKGLLGYQLFNEPYYLGSSTGYGQVVGEVLGLLEPKTPSNPRNPHGLKLSIGAISVLDYHNPLWALDTEVDLVDTGFPQSKFQQLYAWDFHIFLDPWVRNDNWAQGDSVRGDVWRAHRYSVRAPGDPLDPGPALHIHHASRFGSHPGPYASFTSEAGSRHVALQVLNDVLHYNGRVDRDTNQPLYASKGQGFLGWTIFPSDVGGGEGGAFILPGGSVVSWREGEALKDRWRWQPLNSQNGVIEDSAAVKIEGYSDALSPLLLTAPITGSSDFIALSLVAENFDNQGEHGTATLPPTLPNNPDKHRLIAVAARVPPSGPIAWSGRNTVTTSVGALIMDETRQAVRQYQLPTPAQTDPRWPGPVHDEVEKGDSLKCLLRIDLLGRLKMRNHVEPLRPKGVYLGKSGNEHVFAVVYSRPVARSANVGQERYLPEDDVNQPSGQYYFSIYKQPSDPLKYEVLVRTVRVAENPVAVTLDAEQVLRTRGIRGEVWHNAGGAAGTGITQPASADAAGASAIDPQIFASASGDFVVLYRKSQDSWFDVPLAYPNGVDPGFETPARWSVYPWEIFAQIWDSAAGNWILDGSGNPKEFRVSRSFAGQVGDPMLTWHEQMKVQVNYYWPCSPPPCQGVQKNGNIDRRLRMADFHPAVDPHATVWREGSTLKVSVVFKQLNTWITETETWRYPSGYRVLSTEYSSGAFTTPVVVSTDPWTSPNDPGEPDSREAVFSHGEPRVVRCPSLAPPLVRTFQEGRKLFVVDDPGIHSHLSRVTSVESPGTPPFFVTSHESAANGTDGMVTAWLTFTGPAAITLTASGVKGTNAFTTATTMGSLPTTIDFEAKVVGVCHVGNDRFRVVWLQGGVLWRADLLLSTSGLAFDATAGAVQLAGHASKAQQSAPEPHLHSGKVNSSMTDRAVLFTHKGALRFVRL